MGKSHDAFSTNLLIRNFNKEFLPFKMEVYLHVMPNFTYKFVKRVLLKLHATSAPTFPKDPAHCTTGVVPLFGGAQIYDM